MEKINVRDLAGKLNAYLNCVQSNNEEWKLKHAESIMQLTRNLPSGSGLDSGTAFDVDLSNPEKLIFKTAFHHMDSNGYYDGWTYHNIIVTPSLFFGFKIRVTGTNRNEIKTHLADLFTEMFTI